MKNCINLQIEIIKKLPYSKKILDDILQKFKGEELYNKLFEYSLKLEDAQDEENDKQWYDRMQKKFGYTKKELTEFGEFEKELFEGVKNEV